MTNRHKRLVVCLGLPRSGSTWTYNVCRRFLALSHSPDELLCQFSDDFVSPFIDLHDNVRACVVKTHNPQLNLRPLLAFTGAPLLISVRDPRDAVVSLMQCFKLPFHEAAGVIALSAQNIIEISARYPHILLKYESGFTENLSDVRRIRTAIGCPANAAQTQTIHRKLCAASVRSHIAALEQDGVFAAGPAMSVWRPDSHWHPGHIVDGRIGKFRELLSQAQIRRLEQHFATYMGRFGYDDCFGWRTSSETAVGVP